MLMFHFYAITTGVFRKVASDTVFVFPFPGVFVFTRIVSCLFVPMTPKNNEDTKAGNKECFMESSWKKKKIFHRHYISFFTEIPALVTSSWESPLFNYTLRSHDHIVYKSMQSICPPEISVYPGDASRAVKLPSNELVWKLDHTDLTVTTGCVLCTSNVWKHRWLKYGGLFLTVALPPPVVAPLRGKSLGRSQENLTSVFSILLLALPHFVLCCNSVAHVFVSMDYSQLTLHSWARFWARSYPEVLLELHTVRRRD